MKRTRLPDTRRSQCGSVAVEAAIVLPLLVTFVMFASLPWAMYFYKYSAAQKAVHDAALYLSTAPKLELTASGPDDIPAAVTLAKKIIVKEVADLNLPAPSIVCFYKQESGTPVSEECSAASNQDYQQTLVGFSVSINVRTVEPVTGTKLSAYVTVPYVGN